MSERNDLSKAQPTPFIAPAQPPARTAVDSLAAAVQGLPAPDAAKEDARLRILALEREAKVMGNEPAAALLFHEIGLLWEDPLENPRNAAVAFQNAYKLAPRFLSNIRAARRLFSNVGNWQMVVQLVDAELSVVEDPRQKAALLLEKASVLEERLSRDEEAAAAYRACLDLSPRDLSLLIQLEGVYAAKLDFTSLVQVYRLISGALEDVALRAQYLTSAGLLIEERLKQPEAAAACYREAFALDRRDLLLLTAMKRVAEREGKYDELLEALAAEAALLGPQAAPAYLQISKVYERLGRQEDALAALLAARRASPNEPLVLSELARIYEAQRRYEDLADVLLSWVGSINDESEMVAINLRLAALYEEDLKRDQDAIGRYRAILGRVPGHGAALAGLGKLYFRTQHWEGLVSVFEAEVAVAEDPRQKAARMYKAAEVLEERLSRIDDAVSRYSQCLQIQPGYLPAQKALSRLLERQGRFADLVAMYEQDLLQTADQEQIIATLNKMAILYEERLGDIDRAIDCMKRILELAPDHQSTVRNLTRLYERAGHWRELIAHHELEASLAGDTKQILSLRHRNAEILEEQLKDRAGAIAEYERLLSLSPSYLPALKSLGRLYAQDGRWEDLIKMYRAESEIASSVEQAASLIHKIGELYEQRLKNEHEAIASYQEVLTLSPNYFPALRALARIYRGQGAWESLIEVLRAEAANRTDPVERSNALFQAAAIWEDHLSRPDMAVEGYQEVLRLTPSHPTAIRALERLYTSQGNVKDLVAVLDREAQTSTAPSAKVAAFLKLSRLYLDRLQEPSRAAQCCEAVLALEPGNVTALKTLERVRAGDRVRRAEVRARLAERITDGRLRAALRLAAAEHGTSPEALEELKRAAAQDPADPRLTFALEQALRAAGDYDGLARLYERQLASVVDPAERVELALRIADLAESRLNDLPRAAAFVRSALELAPALIPALQSARRVALKLGDYAGARVALEVEGRASRDAQGAIEAFTAAGRLCAERLNDYDGAAANYRRALERDPLDAAASAALEELLAQRGGGADLAALHERRGEAKLAQKDMAAAAQEFYAAACTWLTRTQDSARTMAALDRALMAQPSHAAALELRGQLALDAQQYAEAAAAFAARVQQGGDARTVSAIHLKLGTLYQDHLSDPSRAAAHLQTALSGDPQNVEALGRLAGIHTTSRNWTGAADCLKRLVELEKQPAALAQHLLALARIVDEGFADPTQAAGLYRRALELAPGDAAILDRLVSLYERSNNLGELVQMLEAQAQQAQSAGDLPRAVSLRLKVGELFARPLANPQRALATYRQVVEQLDRNNLAAHVAMAELHMRDAAAGPMAIYEHLQVLRLDPARVDSLHALFRLWEGLKQNDKAFCAAAILYFLKAANEVEAAFYTEAKNRIPTEKSERLLPSDVENLMHPAARNAVVEVLRAVGDQLSKIYPPQFEALGVDRKADRLKPDHAVFKAIRAVAQIFGVEEFEVYQSRRGTMVLETTEPLSICVGQDVIRKFNAREQKFLIGRSVLGLVNKSAVLSKLSKGETAELLGNSVRLAVPEFNGLGRRNEELMKQLRKAYSRKALKALEEPSGAVAGQQKLELQDTLDGLTWSADRAGLLLCGDVTVGLGLVLREDPNAARADGPETLAQAVRQREDLKTLLAFALSDEFFRLRQKLGIAL